MLRICDEQDSTPSQQARLLQNLVQRFVPVMYHGSSVGVDLNNLKFIGVALDALE